MRRSTAIALLVSAVNLPLLAQHGGGHGGGFSGHASASHAAPAFRTGPASAPHPSTPASGSRFSAAKPQFAPGNRSGYPSNYDRVPSSGLSRVPAVHYGAQPMNYGARGNSIAKDEHRPAYRSPYRHPDRGGIVYEYPYAQAAPYYFGYPYGLGFYGDDGFDTEEGYDSSSDSQVAPDDSQPYAPDQYSGFDPQQQQPAQAWPPNRDGDRYRDSYQASGQASDQGAPQSAPDSRYRPYYGTPPRATAVASEPAVTLVFKDHRPNRQIHNYLINGDTITVWDQGPHDIALDQLDIAATEKLNHDAGTDFYLPGPPR